jgi:hypothetical protein
MIFSEGLKPAGSASTPEHPRQFRRRLPNLSLSVDLSVDNRLRNIDVTAA